MKRPRALFLAAVCVFGFGAVALVAQSNAPAGAGMAEAARKFLASLPADQKAKAALVFEAQNRTLWYFTPQQDKQKQPTRKGLRLDEMGPDQRKAALELLRSGLSGKGYGQATQIMSLESLLKE